MKNEVKTLIFDVNETLLNMEALKTSVNEALGHSSAFDCWFPKLLQYSLVESITGKYSDFSSIATAVLKMEAKSQGKDFNTGEIQQILSPVTSLEPYPDVVPGLERLKEGGFKMVALSNGKPDILEKQLKFAEIDQLFDKILSIEGCKKYKPHPESYNYAVEAAEGRAIESMMVAAHGWDIAGANRAGLKTAFINRQGKQLFPLAEKPDIDTSNIESLASLLNNS